MVTLGGFIEFEHTMPKMTASTAHAIAMVAGETLVGTRISQEVAAELQGANPTIADIAGRLAAHYEQARRARIENQILGARGLDFESYYRGQASLNAQIILMLDQQMSQFNLGVELLLAGIDPTGGHIYTIHNPGSPEALHDIIGYAAVGSGAIHALQSMIGFRHSPAAEYHATVFRVYASKRRAEVAPGVGSDTDLAVISPEGIHVLTAAELDKLAKIYDEFEQSTSLALGEQLAEFSLGEAGDEPAADASPNGTPGKAPEKPVGDG
jgi:20S proteasome alpha/beta subunit